MGEMCSIFNATKKEQISFDHIDASTPRECAGNSASSAIIAWYLSTNRGDRITFIGDYDDTENLPFGLSSEEIYSWPDKTNEIVDALIENKILEDHGKNYEDVDDPENIYIRDLRNCW
jgi:hypothetical protein